MKKLRNISKERHLQNLRRSVDRSGSSWRSGDWEGRWCWSARSCRTWWDPRTWWTPWFHWAQSCPDLWDQKLPKTKSALSPTNYTGDMTVISDFIIPLLGEFPVSQAVVDIYHDLFISFIQGLAMFYYNIQCYSIYIKIKYWSTLLLFRPPICCKRAVLESAKGSLPVVSRHFFFSRSA